MKKIITLILLTSLLISCGSKKTIKVNERVRLETEIGIKTDESKVESTNVKTETKTTVDDKDETVVKETIYELNDITKPGIIIDKNGNKLVLGNIKSTTKETTKKNNTKVEDSKSKDSISNIKVDLNKGELNKGRVEGELRSGESDRKQYNPFMLLWLLIPLGLIYRYRLTK